MVIFVDARPIKLINSKKKHSYPPMEDFDVIIDGRLKPIKIADFKGHTCLLNVSVDQMEKIIEELHGKKPFDFHSLYILTSIKQALKEKICSLYTVIEAAGGVVQNDSNEVLWIYRLGKWDLPKGGTDKGEEIEDTAMREVEEETGVNGLSISKKLQKTYHIFKRNGVYKLKITHWFEMQSTYDGIPVGQAEEGIEKVEWKNPEQIKEALKNSYENIKLLFEE